MARELTSEELRGRWWDGTYFRVVDSVDDKIYTYDSDGRHISSLDIDLTKSAPWPRYVDSTNGKVYTYDLSGDRVDL